ncbi:BgTH12-01283 [Blumeria graminis f. sp. triticale]|uniref:Bgt-1339 n=3 Tax=Blumeria graminis TaxID=34373 RepID=A0A381L2V6_BLUGR|nr:hypothetical protein BGT96224_1339 [Blumeria graminis f. sp. tritici 96224]CAD6505796.1 BgTH12-01283 [Blumeria graminis f. sp. triticale]VDB93968.1 Bgt-1339 [Blumeria graminis f. sp. tritici]
MAQYGDESYGIPLYSSRSPGSMRGGHLIYRQPSHSTLSQSLHFENFRNSISMQPPGLYNDEQTTGTARYDPTSRFDRMTAVTLHSGYPFDNQTWSYGAPNNNCLMAGTGRPKATNRRPCLPNGWMEQPATNTGINNYHPQPQFSQPSFHQIQRRSSPNSASDSEELIPTALVIKNIPFAVKKEQILQLMTDMTLPLPYAFNYHFDQGVFRGLAFANFSSPEETKIVIEHMNSMDLNGRKLRVEYKKMLPIQERERIERDKREKRGQLEEQHRPIPPGQVHNPLHNQASINSLGSGQTVSPSPVSMRDKFGQDIDLNDPVSLGYYTEIVVFKKDPSRDSLIFPASISPADRRQIHTMAHHLGLEHRSQGEGDGRCVQILKKRPAEICPPIPHLPGGFYNESRRGLNRAATIDFSEALGNEGYQRTVGRQASGLLDTPLSPGLAGLNGSHNLRAAKSFADLRSYTPSPAPSTASFPVGLQQNIIRYTDYGHSPAASGTPSLTPTSAGATTHRDELYLNNNMSNLSLFDNRLTGNRTNGVGRIGTERDPQVASTGPIGSQRPTSGCKIEEIPRTSATASLSQREPRNPGPDWGAGNGSFTRPRQNGPLNLGNVEIETNVSDNVWDDNRAQETSDRGTNLNNRNTRYQL